MTRERNNIFIQAERPVPVSEVPILVPVSELLRQRIDTHKDIPELVSNRYHRTLVIHPILTVFNYLRPHHDEDSWDHHGGLNILSDETRESLNVIRLHVIDRNNSIKTDSEIPFFILSLPDRRIKKVDEKSLSAKDLYNSIAHTYNDAYATEDMLAGDNILRDIQQVFITDLIRRRGDSHLVYLDIGCGLGNFLDRHKDIPHENYLGIDNSEGMIINAMLLKPGYHFMHADAENVQYKENSIDVVAADYAPINYMKNPQKFYHNVFNGLKDQGLLMVMPYTNPVAKGENIDTEHSPSTSVADREFKSLQEHIHMLNETGFIIEEIVGINRNVSLKYKNDKESGSVRSVEEYSNLMKEEDSQARSEGISPDEYRHMIIIARKPLIKT